MNLATRSSTTGISANPKYGSGTNGAIYISDIRLFKYVAGTTTTPGTAVLRVYFARVNGTQLPMNRDINIIIYDKNVDGIFQMGTDICYSDQSFYVDAACSSLGGTTDLADSSRCKSLNIYGLSGTSTPAITLNGDLTVFGMSPQAGNITTKSGDYVMDKAGANYMRLGTNASSIEVVAGTSSGAGPNLKLNNPAGEASLSGTSSVKLAATAATINANATTFNNAAAGNGTVVTVNGNTNTTGSGYFGGTLAVGTNNSNGWTFYDAGSAFVAGATQLNSTLYVAGTSTLNGAANTNSTLVVAGTAPAAGYSLTVNGSSITTGNTQINGSETINGNLTVGTNSQINGSENVSGVFTATGGVLSTSGGFATTNQSAAGIGAVGSNGNRLVTKDWVYSLLTANQATLMDANQKDAIVSYVLQQTNLGGWLALKGAIIGNIGLSPGNNACPAGQFVSNIAWNPSGVSASTSVLSYTCTALPAPASAPDCTVQGNCGVVWSNWAFCSSTTGRCQSNVKYHVWDVCGWARNWGWEFYDPTTGLVNWFCPVNWIVAGTRNIAGSGWHNSEPFCCPMAAR